MKNDENLNFIEYFAFLKNRKKKIFLHSSIIFLILVGILFLNSSKINSFKYEQHIRIVPISYISFSKLFLYSDVELKLVDEKSSREISVADDSFSRQALSPLTIFYHYISIVDTMFNENFYIAGEEKSNFGYFENKWNTAGLKHEFNVNVYGNDFKELDNKVKEIFIDANKIIILDLINYLERYSSQKNFNKLKSKQLAKTIELLKKENNVTRLYISKKTKIINNNQFHFILALFFSILVGILIQTLNSNFSNNK